MNKKWSTYLGYFLAFLIFLALVLFDYYAKATETDTRNCVRSWCYKQLDVRETGANKGDSIKAYLRNVNLPEGYPYCAAFAYSGLLACDVANLPDCPARSDCWFKEDVIWITGGTTNKTPKLADFAGFYYEQLKRIAHIGVIIIWDAAKGVCVVIAGNTADVGHSREGDGVYLKIYRISQIHKVSDKITGSSVSAKPKARYHIIQKKETLYRISIIYQTTPEKIMQCNGLTGTDIYIGQRIKIC